jgi:hypothetical protein
VRCAGGFQVVEWFVDVILEMFMFKRKKSLFDFVCLSMDAGKIRQNIHVIGSFVKMI